MKGNEMNQTSPIKISIIMVDGAYRSYYFTIDSFGKQTFPACDYELLWVEYYDKIKPDLANKLQEYHNCKAITLNQAGKYHSSYCFNAGIERARGELIIIPDGDVLCEEHFLETVWEEHQTNKKLVMYISRFDEPEEEHRTDISMEHLRKVCVLRNPSNYGGCITVRKHWFIAINGYEQHPVFRTGFHANGLDVYTRLKNLGLHIMWHPDLKLFHPWHPFTSHFSDAYTPQHMLIHHRACQKESLSYLGLDPNRNRDVPRELGRKLETGRLKTHPLWHRVLKKLKLRLS